MIGAPPRSQLDRVLSDRLAVQDARGLRRRLRPLDAGPAPTATIDGRAFIQLASNDYLGLATHPAVTRAAADAAAASGAGAGSARLIAGSTAAHADLEAALAALKHTDAAVLFSSGYHANIGVLPALMGPADAIFSDALNHASLIDGCRLSRATIHVYRHADVDHLDALLATSPPAAQRAIVTETLFGMDGDLAPLESIVEVARRRDAWVIVDEAHATGVFGPRGGGLVEHTGLAGEVDVQIGTLSKALGALGGFVAGSQALIDWLINAARPFVYTTALPPPVVAAARVAVDLVMNGTDRRERLWSHAERLRDGLSGAGFRLGPSVSPILPLLVGDTARAMRMSRILLERGVLIPAIRPPTVPDGTARLRIAPMATHAQADLDAALGAIVGAARDTGVLP